MPTDNFSSNIFLPMFAMNWDYPLFSDKPIWCVLTSLLRKFSVRFAKCPFFCRQNLYCVWSNSHLSCLNPNVSHDLLTEITWSHSVPCKIAWVPPNMSKLIRSSCFFLKSHMSSPFVAPNPQFPTKNLVPSAPGRSCAGRASAASPPRCRCPSFPRRWLKSPVGGWFLLGFSSIYRGWSINSTGIVGWMYLTNDVWLMIGDDTSHHGDYNNPIGNLYQQTSLYNGIYWLVYRDSPFLDYCKIPISWVVQSPN